MSQQTIYNELRKAGMTKTGACAMIGNMQAESGCESLRLQGDYNSNRAMSKRYVNDVDNGRISASTFIYDSKGFGLIQWTFYSRKQTLYNFAKSLNVSIADENMQVKCVIKELKESFRGLWNYLTTTSDLYKATDRICREFEAPAVNNVNARYQFAQKAFEALNDGGSDIPEPIQPIPSGNKSLENIAKEVIRGEWGNGTDRRNRLTNAGYPYDKIQRIVNQMFANTYKPTSETTQPYNLESSKPNPQPKPKEPSIKLEYWPPRTLKANMEGHDVAVWQALLIANGYVCNINGSFENNTIEETKKYQKAHSLTPNGIVNYNTWQRMLDI